ncbi:Alpha/Beta hydrolase protein [Kalaharituber pfeilii]|nr:Alpha/Beta hydrolase protein [Kalaharituber pfeilii]
MPEVNGRLVAPMKYERITSQPENPFFDLISDQSVAVVPLFTLESGVTLHQVPVAYKTWGKLNANRDNAMVICHALTGSADVEDWWGPLIGPGRAFDTKRYFVVCCNSLGSPYGSASPCTLNPDTGERYGPEFPLTTIRDDVAIHKLILDDLGVKQVAVAIGGSMGGMLVLEWAYYGLDYVRAIVPLATSARHSAWCISWGEAQRQSIYSDPKYDDGYYPFDDPPVTGLGAARMSALLTYRSRNSFESRFGRNTPDPSRIRYINQPYRPPSTPQEEHWAVHNDGLKNGKRLASQSTSPRSGNSPPPPSTDNLTTTTSPLHPPHQRRAPTYFSAQSYLRYQGEKFVKRFDSNCYIAITRKLDTHDVSRGRAPINAEGESTSPGNVAAALAQIKQPTLVIGIESDGLFTFQEQQELATYIPNARLERIDSPEGHDAFLLQFEEVNRHISDFLREVLPEVYVGEEATSSSEDEGVLADGAKVEKKKKKGGLVTEVDDITAW